MKSLFKTIAIIAVVELCAPSVLAIELSQPGEFANPVPTFPPPPDVMSSGPQYVSPPPGVDSSVSNCHSAGCVGVGREGYYSSTTSTWDNGSSTHIYPPTGDQYQVVCNGGLCQTFGR